MPDSYDPRFFRHLVAVEDRHFWFRARRRVVRYAAASIEARLRSGYRVLEVGCGNGGLLHTLGEAFGRGSVVGMDLHHDALAFARQRTSGPLVVADVMAAPFGACFDVVGVFDVLEHLSDDGLVLRQLRGLLREGGSLLVTVPAYRCLWSDFDEASCHVRRYEEAELRAKLGAAGYTVEYLTPFLAITLPLFWAERRLGTLLRGFRPRRAPAEELVRRGVRVPPLVNPVLAWLLFKEARLVARRARLPAGSSLLAIARAGAR